MNLNRVTIIGHLGRDPETRHAQSGTAICNMSVAVSESWKDKSGERQERTEWFRVVIFHEALAKSAQQYLRKGSKVYVEGKLQSRKWTDKDGAEKTTTEVVLGPFGSTLIFLDGKREGGGGEGEPAEPRRSSAGARTTTGAGYRAPPRGGGDLDDEIPFAPEWRV